MLESVGYIPIRSDWTDFLYLSPFPMYYGPLFFNFNLLFPAVFPSCNFLKEFLPSYHFCYTIFISSTTCEGESLVKLPTRCDRIRLRSALPLMVLLGADSCFFSKGRHTSKFSNWNCILFRKKWEGFNQRQSNFLWDPPLLIIFTNVVVYFYITWSIKSK